MTKRKTPWGWIALGIAALIVLIGVGLIVAAGVVVYQQFAFESQPATEKTAERKFEDIAKRFAGQKPLIVIEDGMPVIRKVPHERPKQTVQGLHVLVWDPSDERVVSLNIPFWLIRMTGGRPIKLSSGHRDTDTAPQLKITAEDLERFGPGLILIHREPGGERVIVWAQ